MNKDTLALERTTSLMPGSQGMLVTQDLEERQVEALANARVNWEVAVSTVARQMCPQRRAV
jgi:hypothetical protein